MRRIVIAFAPWALFTGLFIAGAVFGMWRERTAYDPAFDWVALFAGFALGILALVLRVRVRP